MDNSLNNSLDNVLTTVLELNTVTIRKCKNFGYSFGFEQMLKTCISRINISEINSEEVALYFIRENLNKNFLLIGNGEYPKFNHLTSVSVYDAEYLLEKENHLTYNYIIINKININSIPLYGLISYLTNVKSTRFDKAKIIFLES